MIGKDKLAIPCAVLFACASAFGYSNPIEGGSTETVTNQWNVPLPWLMVGSNSGSNTLEVVDGGVVNSQVGYLGNTASSTHNQAIVSSSGVWSNSIELSVGYQGASNSLTVADGGTVATPNAYIGNNSDGNQATVTGNGSVLSASRLDVGHQGSSNGLLVASDGAVESDTGTIGYWIGSDGNIATVQSNGTWNSSMEINVGEYGSGNQLVVGDDGMVDTPVVNVGVQSISSSNTVTVSGSGALLESPELYIGGSSAGTGGTGNRVEVENGGTVAAIDLNIYSGNSFDLNDGGRLFVNTNFNASMSGFNFNTGGTLEVGGELTGMGSIIKDQRTVILNGSAALWNNGFYNLLVDDNGSTLILARGARLKSGAVSVSDGGLIHVTGVGSTANMADVRVDGKDSRLVIDDGGLVIGGNGYVGSSTESGSSSFVQGAGSAWSNKYELYVGCFGDDNLLEVSDGGRVYNRNSYIGKGPNATGNAVTISGEGSQWVNRGILMLGEHGSYNSLSAVDGGCMEDESGYIGYASGADNNSAVVSGNGSIWRNTEGLYLGGHYSGTNWIDGGTGNSLMVEKGGKVLVGNGDTSGLSSYANSGVLLVGDAGGTPEMFVANGSIVADDYGFIGWGENNSGSVTVSGFNSVWDNSRSFIVGAKGSGNRLLVEDGARVEDQSAFIGSASSAVNNSVRVAGDNSIWVSSDALVVGDSGSSNRLTIADGGRVENSYGTIGFSAGANHNSVLVTGINSVWANAGELRVGLTGSNNDLSIADGGRVENNFGYIGYNAASGNNSVLVTGSNSVWVNSYDLSVGRDGSSNSLAIVDGGHVENATGYIGRSAGSDHNSVLVNGNRSVWTNSGALYIGTDGSGNSMSIEDGGRVEDYAGYIGDDAASGNNSALVTGTNSVWHNRAELMVGLGGSGNSLRIEGGGRVENTRGYIGYSSSSDNNSALVTGANSVWENSDGLYIGSYGAGNSLVIAGGGVVESAETIIGGTSFSNTVLVSGVGSVLNNDELYVGNNGAGNSLTVENGGAVVSSNSYIGFASSASDNQVAVSGGRWINSGSLVVGFDGSNNGLAITNSGFVQSDNGYIGYEDMAAGNLVSVSGSGSEWENTGPLYVGYNGARNALRIGDGGQVFSMGGAIGYGETANSNRVVITGEGTSWVQGLTAERLESAVQSGLVLSEGKYLLVGGDGSSGELVIADGASANLTSIEDATSIYSDLVVGYMGSDNILEMESGGLATNYNGIIGETSYAGDNKVAVSGSGSEWINLGDLTVGNLGSRNTLAITNLGYVENATGYIGVDAMAVENTVIVDGPGSYWLNKGGLQVGFAGSNNSLIITNGAVAQTLGGASIGHEVGAVGNRVVVSGRDSAWGVGVVVPRRIVLHPIYPPFPGSGSGGSSSGSVIVVGRAPILGTPANSTNGNTIIVGNAGSITSGGSGLMISDSNQINISDGTVVMGGSNFIYTNPVSSIAISNGNYNPVTQYMLEGSLGDLAVGYAGSFNTLDIEDGALVSGWNVVIGETSNAWSNAVSVVGSNSELNVYRDLSLGGRMSLLYYMTAEGWKNDWSAGGQGNSLYVADGGLVSVGEDMHNRNYSTVSLDPGGRINVASNYYQDATSMLRFGVDTNSAGAPVNALVSVGGTAVFEEGAQIEYASNVGELQFGRFYTNKLIEADALVVAGIDNPDSLDLEKLDASGSLVDVIFWENDQRIYALAGRKYLADSAGFANGTMMARLSKEIDDMSLLGDDNANNMINLLNTLPGDEQNAQLRQQYERGAPSFLHVQGMAEGLGELTKHTSRRPAEMPEGAAGPHRADQGMRGWVKPYGSWADHSAHGGFAGYNHNIYGTLVGVDWLRDDVLLGFAGGYARSVINQDDGDDSVAKTGYGVGYVSFGTGNWFGDINLAIGRSSIKDESGTMFGTHSDHKASNYALYLGGGREIRSRNGRVILTPEGSVLMSDYIQNAYTEGGMLPREVHAYERTSIASSLGATLAVQQEFDIMILKPEVRAHWLHEFDTDTESASYSLVGGTGEYHYSMPAAEENMLEAGAGLTAQFHDELSLGLDVDWRFGKDYDAYTVSGRMVYEF